MSGLEQDSLKNGMSGGGAGVVVFLLVVGCITAVAMTDFAKPILLDLRTRLSTIGAANNDTSLATSSQDIAAETSKPLIDALASQDRVDNTDIVAGNPAVPLSQITDKGLMDQSSMQDADKDQQLPTFDIVRVEPTGDAVIAGLAQPGDGIEIVSGDTIIAEAIANDVGEWVIVLDEPLQPGGYNLAIRALSADGEIRLSDQRIVVAIPRTVDEIPIVMLDEPDAPSTLLQIPAAVDLPDRSDSSVVISDAPADQADQKPDSLIEMAGSSNTPSELKADTGSILAEANDMAASAEPVLDLNAKAAEVVGDVTTNTAQGQSAPNTSSTSQTAATDADLPDPVPEAQLSDVDTLESNADLNENKTTEPAPTNEVTSKVAEAQLSLKNQDDEFNSDTRMDLPNIASNEEPIAEADVVQEAKISMSSDERETLNPESQSAPDQLDISTTSANIGRLDSVEVQTEKSDIPIGSTKLGASDEMSEQTTRQHDNNSVDLALTTGSEAGSSVAVTSADEATMQGQTAALASSSENAADVVEPVVASEEVVVPQEVVAAEALEGDRQMPAIDDANLKTSNLKTETLQNEAEAGSSESVIDLIVSAENLERQISVNDPATFPEIDEEQEQQRPSNITSLAPNALNSMSEENPEAAQQTGSDSNATAIPLELAPLVSVEAIEVEEGAALFVAGGSRPSALVRIYFDDVFVGEATVGETGRWLLETQRALPVGQYSVRVEQVDKADGSVLARRIVPFERHLDLSSLTPVANGRPGSERKSVSRQEAGGSATRIVNATMPAPQAVIIRRGDNLWTISRRLYGKGIRYTTIYQANDDQIRNPNLIYPGQIFVLPSEDATLGSGQGG